MESVAITVEVTKEHLKDMTEGMNDEMMEAFLRQLEPRLALVLEVEAKTYVQEALIHFGEANESS